MYGSHYQVLGIAPDATDIDIRKAYKLKAKTLHPDVNKSERAAEEFVSLRVAFETLIDSNKRFIYDQGNQPVKGFKNVGQYVKGARQFRFMPSYEQWIELKKQKIKAEREEEQLRWARERNRIQTSPYFFWIKLSFYLQIFFLYALVFAIFIAAGYFIVNTHFVFSFVILPMPCAGAFLAFWTYRKYRQQIFLYR